MLGVSRGPLGALQLGQLFGLVVEPPDEDVEPDLVRLSASVRTEVAMSASVRTAVRMRAGVATAIRLRMER